MSWLPATTTTGAIVPRRRSAWAARRMSSRLGRGAVEEVAAVHDQVGGVVLGDAGDLVQDGVDLAVTSMAADLAAQVPVGGVEHASRHGFLQRNGLRSGAGCAAAFGGSADPTVLESQEKSGKLWNSGRRLVHE